MGNADDGNGHVVYFFSTFDGLIRIAMSRIKIKNFGPIKEGLKDNDGWVDIEKTTIFIGNQGSGKSTIAKLISTFTWMEKAYYRGDYDNKWFSRKNKLKNQFLNYHRLENYLIEKNGKTISEIEYEGDACRITFKNDILNIEKLDKKYALPQVMYVPAERNFIAYVRTAKELKVSSDSFQDFNAEFEKAKKNIKQKLKLPINDIYLEYDRLNDVLNISNEEEYKIKLSEASSGFQSLAPLYLVSKYLTDRIKKGIDDKEEGMSSDERERFRKQALDIYSNKDLTEEQKRILVSEVASRFNKSSFINIVEEPEQNLYPTSQQKMFNSLMEFNNSNEANKLIITTHSPYLVNHIGILVKAGNLLEKYSSIEKKINEIVPTKSAIKGKKVAIYEMNLDGSIEKLGNYNGIPDDDDFLNQELVQSNEDFAQLLEIE
ncbi:AAA family ATPase [Bergeyella zoohelcum]|uniref:Endonuclease GajA/Old nuclease/RecF-like AAA domain-containing protein n=1 Tax=Bergeyella zoohelcum ATCC 43767 TaxID=883096 RepID=K1LZE0_9FLAO|nr:AAA family ATPase [Bergeyella zoohelcum]EKB57362.1 hypothetical protein HMPREF9699_00848 [Bergeyella zoohelcum ATCC 43767]SUV48967.1 Predicted ATP-binding protein involved in virulence [Bergeyella zoohelcum]